MTSISKRLLVVLTFLAAGMSADAQSPREQLQQMTAQLQQTPNDIALRERIIKLGAKIKPAPAVSEEANRSFVRGNVFQKEARDASGYELAISAYREALRAAPWWGDAYFNLAVAQESAGKFDEAIASNKRYMASVPVGSSDAREAQNRIYAIEAKSEMASQQAIAEQQSQAVAANANQAAMRAQEQRISGVWQGMRFASREGERFVVLYVRQTSDGRWNLLYDNYFDNKQVAKEVQGTERDVSIVDGQLRFKMVTDWTGVVCATWDVRGTVSADGNTLNLAYTLMPFESYRPADKCNPKSSYESYSYTYNR